MDIPLDAKVRCTDGNCGKSTFVIANPVTRVVTHFVVKDKNLPGNPVRLVPVERIAEVSGGLIRLDCTRAEVAEMQPFATTHYVQEEVPDSIFAGDPNGRGAERPLQSTPAVAVGRVHRGLTSGKVGQ